MVGCVAGRCGLECGGVVESGADKCGVVGSGARMWRCDGESNSGCGDVMGSGAGMWGCDGEWYTGCGE